MPIRERKSGVYGVAWIERVRNASCITSRECYLRSSAFLLALLLPNYSPSNHVTLIILLQLFIYDWIPSTFKEFNSTVTSVNKVICFTIS